MHIYPYNIYATGFLYFLEKDLYFIFEGYFILIHTNLLLKGMHLDKNSHPNC